MTTSLELQRVCYNYSTPGFYTPLSFSPYHDSTLNNANQIRIAVTLSSLFDLSEALTLRKNKGQQAYFRYMDERADVPLNKGPSFAFVSKLMKLNKPGKPYVSLTILTKLCSETVKRVHYSIAHHGLVERPLRDMVSLWEGPAIEYLFKTPENYFDLILSSNSFNVKTALANGHPAGLTDPYHIAGNNGDSDIHIGFDFDRVLGLAMPPSHDPHAHLDHEGFSNIFVKKNGQDFVWAREESFGHIPAEDGPQTPLFHKLRAIRNDVNADPYLPNMKISIITARDKGRVKRVETTCQKWGFKPDFMESTGWGSKGKVLNRIGVDAFFDDGLHHIQDTQKESPTTLGVHVPWTDNHLKRLYRQQTATLSRIVSAVPH